MSLSMIHKHTAHTKDGRTRSLAEEGSGSEDTIDDDAFSDSDNEKKTHSFRCRRVRQRILARRRSSRPGFTSLFDVKGVCARRVCIGRSWIDLRS